LRSLRPDFRKLSQLKTRGIIVTAPSDDPRFDFVSRFFAPAAGVDEDPVTGSAHCCLGPFWAERLGKSVLTGFQASPRGGIVHVRVAGDRVILGGRSVTIFRGHLALESPHAQVSAGGLKTPAATESFSSSNNIVFSESRDLPLESVLTLYRAHGWSSADKPELLHKALRASHSLITAWDGPKLVGLGNAISDGHLVAYYPHLLVHPEYQGRGIGAQLMQRLMARYDGFHQHMLVADGRAVDFYRKCGFERAGKTEPMWIYAGKDHS
jgi:GNAT superfamily N-acetyltransferase